MKPSSFEFLTPSSLSEASAALQDNPGAMIIAGGQSLVPALNFKLASPSVLVNIRKIPDLGDIEIVENALVIGANVKHYQIEENREVEAKFPLMQEAMRYVAHSPIRNQGTLVGSLCHADSAAEMPILLVLTGGHVTAFGPNGKRNISASDFFRFHMTTTRADNEIITHAHFPIPTKSSGYSFAEFARRSGDYAISAIAVLMEVDDNVLISSIGVAAGGLASCPTKLSDVEKVLLGKSLNATDIEQASEICKNYVTAPDDVHAKLDYRKYLTSKLLAKALLEAKKRAKKGNIE